MAMDILDKLKELQIKYEIVEHQPVYTIADAKKTGIDEKIDGTEVKNLFLKDKNNNFYIYVLEAEQKADFKFLKDKIGSRPEFATEDELYEKLNLHPGSVTPLGIFNDNGSVIILLDKNIKYKKILVHPNRNTATISIEFNDLIKFIIAHNNKYFII